MSRFDKPVRSPLARLTVEFVRLIFIWLVGVLLLWQQWSAWEYATRWFLASSLVSVYLLVVTGRHLPNHQKNGHLLPKLGVANHITLLRGWSLACIAGFALAPQPEGWLAWMPTLLYGVMSSTDLIDGYIARKTGYDTPLGERLDLEMDGLGVWVVCAIAVRWGQLPIWYLLIGLLMYLFFAGMWWRKQRGYPLYDMPKSTHRRLVAGVEMGFFAVILWPVAPSSLTTTAGIVFTIPITLSFLRDWLFVNGRLRQDNTTYQQVRKRLYQLTAQQMPPILRLIAFISATQLSLEFWPHWAWGLFFMVGIACVTLGIMPRLCSIILMLPIAIHTLSASITIWHHLLVAALLSLILLGGGRFALWAKEERYFMNPLGST